tara:strand:- start:3499 stop:3765 length:267 start_codon:yes stop_codon:yes gene_type:complete
MNSSKAYELKYNTDDLNDQIDHQKQLYIFVLDTNDGKAYRYIIDSLANDENNWNPDAESCEAFLYGAGHNVSNCVWMVTNESNINYGN